MDNIANLTPLCVVTLELSCDFSVLILNLMDRTPSVIFSCQLVDTDILQAWISSTSSYFGKYSQISSEFTSRWILLSSTY